MSIIDKIKSSVEGATGLLFHYDTPETLNTTIETAAFPCAMMNIIQSGAVTDANGIMRERLTIEVLFTALSSLDFDGVKVEREELDAMKKAAFKWVQSLFRSRDIRLISNNGTNRYYATNDMIVSAYGINVTIEEIEGVAPCEVEPVPPAPIPVMIEQHLFQEDGLISNVFTFDGGRIYDRNIEIAQPFGMIGAFYYIVSGVEITFVSEHEGEIWIYCEKGVEMKVHFDDIDHDADENGIIKIQYNAGNHKIRKANSYNAKVGVIQLYEYRNI